MVENPAELAGGKVRIERQARAFHRQGFRTLALQPFDHVLAARILPDDGVVDRRAALAVPGDHRLALIVDAQGLCIAGARCQLLHMLQQLGGVMFHPAGLGKYLAMLESAEQLERAGGIQAIGLAAGGPLIDGDDGGHCYSSMKSTVM